MSADFVATGRDVDGGYAEYMTVPQDYAAPIPPVYSDAEAAPLLCAGAVGYRALKLADGQRLVLTGFGGRLVINAIRKEAGDKEQLLRLSYPEHLWLEKEIKSVANVTNADIARFLEIAVQIPIRPEVETYRLEGANRALVALKREPVREAKVLVME